jgi:hypothetical protein
MIHIDTADHTEEIRPDRPMVLNAGAGLSHDEQVVGADDVDMHQIFVRPERAGGWRLRAGFDGSGDNVPDLHAITDALLGLFQADRARHSQGRDH